MLNTKQYKVPPKKLAHESSTRNQYDEELDYELDYDCASDINCGMDTDEQNGYEEESVRNSPNNYTVDDPPWINSDYMDDSNSSFISNVEDLERESNIGHPGIKLERLDVRGFETDEPIFVDSSDDEPESYVDSVNEPLQEAAVTKEPSETIEGPFQNCRIILNGNKGFTVQRKVTPTSQDLKNMIMALPPELEDSPPPTQTTNIEPKVMCVWKHRIPNIQDQTILSDDSPPIDKPSPWSFSAAHLKVKDIKASDEIFSFFPVEFRDYDDALNHLPLVADRVPVSAPARTPVTAPIFSSKDFKIPTLLRTTKPIPKMSLKPDVVVDLTEDDVLSLYESESIFEYMDIKEEPLDEEKSSKSSSVGSRSSQSNPMEPKKQHKLDFTTIPLVFNQLCYHFFFNEKCKLSLCKRPHYLQAGMLKRLLQNTTPRIVEIYEFIKPYPLIHQPMHWLCSQAFLQKGNFAELVELLKDTYYFDYLDTKEYIMLLFDYSITFMPFQNFLKNLVEKIDFCDFKDLSNIIFEDALGRLRFIDDETILDELSEGRVELFNPLYVERLLQLLQSYPVDVKLFNAIDKYIFKRELVNLTEISPSLLKAFHTLAASRNKRQFDSELDKFIQSNSAGYVDNKTKYVEQYIKALNPAVINSVSPESPNTYLYNPESYVPLNGPDHNLMELDSASNLNALETGPEYWPDQNPLDVSLTTGNNLNEGDEVESYAEVECASSVAAGRLPGAVMFDYRVDNKIMEFGNAVYNPHFKLNEHCHNLYVHFDDNIELNDEDIIALDKVIIERNGPKYLMLIENYKRPCTVERFICNTIAALKALRKSAFETFSNLVNSMMQVNPELMKQSHTKAILEVIAFNILFELEKKSMFREATRLLYRFNDWSSLISSKIISNRCNYSIHGRYMYLCKILMKSGDYARSIEIFLNPHLKLLDSPYEWSRLQAAKSDWNVRNILLHMFFENSYKFDIVSVRMMFKYHLTVSRIFDFEATKYLDAIFAGCLKDKEMKNSLFLLQDIHHYISYLDKNIIRALIVKLGAKLESDAVNYLFEQARIRGVYDSYTGREQVVNIRMDMSDTEINLILSRFFEKMMSTLSCQGIVIQINTPTSRYFYPDLLTDLLRSTIEINEGVKKFLKEKYGIEPEATNAAILKISAIQIRQKIYKR